MESAPQEITREEGRRLLKSGQVDRAIEVLEKVAENDPDDAAVHCYLGVAYNMRGDKLRAIASFEESLRLEKSAKAYYNLGLIYQAAHRVEEAVRQYEMALTMDPDYTRAREALDRLHAQFEAEHPHSDGSAHVCDQ